MLDAGFWSVEQYPAAIQCLLPFFLWRRRILRLGNLKSGSSGKIFFGICRVNGEFRPFITPGSDGKD
jgi:hypothetical protein